MRRRHLVTTAALSALLAVPVAANAQTTSTVKVTDKSSVAAGTTLRVGIQAVVPTALRRARNCTVRLAGVKNLTGSARLTARGGRQRAQLKLPPTLKPGRYRLVTACGGIAKRTVTVVTVRPPAVGVSTKLIGGPKLQGRLGTTSFAWAAEVTNPDTILDAYSVTVTVTMTDATGQQLVDRQLVRRIPAGATITVGDHVDLPLGGAPLTTAQATASARFGLTATKQPLPIVTPNPIRISGVITAGQVTQVSLTGQVNSALSGTTTRRSWVTFFDAAGAFVGAVARPDIALPPGASPLDFSLSDITVPPTADHALVNYEG